MRPSWLFRVYDQRVGFAPHRCTNDALLHRFGYGRVEGNDRANRSSATHVWRQAARPVLPCHVHERTRAIRLVHGRIKAIPHYVRSRERAICPRGNAAGTRCLLECARGRTDAVRLKPVKLASSHLRVFGYRAQDRLVRKEQSIYNFYNARASRDRDCDSRGGTWSSDSTKGIKRLSLGDVSRACLASDSTEEATIIVKGRTVEEEEKGRIAGR